ncbi:hypothetical protein OCU04_000018 [Sclerotinia nivalis]|uniref:Uncharacterized protein n=1 Tax=Sclerotinia nivalis TaxID=352851 RepID=A0A9X0AVV7_9HELO|nr:hypothetical protein OCU04_000018 [Sclerotinia nivalis]
MFSCITLCQDVTLRDRFNLAGISSVIGERSIADVPPNRRRITWDLPSYVSLRDIQGISDNDLYIDTIYSQNIVQGTFGHPKFEIDAVKQPNNDSFTSSDSCSPSFPSYTASPHIARNTTQRRSSSSQPPPPKLPHLSPSTVQGNSSPRSSFDIQPTPEPASPASQSSNQDCLLPLQTPVTIEELSQGNSISVSAVRPPTTPGNFSGRSTLLAGLQDRSFQYKCDHCSEEFPRPCDLKYVTRNVNRNSG